MGNIVIAQGDAALTALAQLRSVTQGPMVAVRGRRGEGFVEEAREAHRILQATGVVVDKPSAWNRKSLAALGALVTAVPHPVAKVAGPIILTAASLLDAGGPDFDERTFLTHYFFKKKKKKKRSNKNKARRSTRGVAARRKKARKAKKGKTKSSSGEESGLEGLGGDGAGEFTGPEGSERLENVGPMSVEGFEGSGEFEGPEEMLAEMFVTAEEADPDFEEFIYEGGGPDFDFVFDMEDDGGCALHDAFSTPGVALGTFNGPLPRGVFFQSPNLRAEVGPAGASYFGKIELANSPVRLVVTDGIGEYRATIALAHELTHLLNETHKLGLTHEQVHTSGIFWAEQGLPVFKAWAERLHGRA